MKLSFKATTHLKIGLKLDIDLFTCRNVFAIYCVRVWTCQIFSLLRLRCVSITLRRLKHRRFFTESALRSSHPYPRPRNYCTRVWTRQIFSLLHHRCVCITIRRLKHQRFFTESTLRSPAPFLVPGTIVQECGLARSDLYYVTAAPPLHYAVSSIDGSSHSWHCDSLTGAAIIYRGSQTSCYQNPLVGFFNVNFDFFAFLRMRALGLQVKLLFRSLLSLATSIIHYVLVIFVS